MMMFAMKGNPNYSNVAMAARARFGTEGVRAASMRVGRRKRLPHYHCRTRTAILASVSTLSPVAFWPCWGTAGRSTSATERTRPVNNRSLTTLARSPSIYPDDPESAHYDPNAVAEEAHGGKALNGN